MIASVTTSGVVNLYKTKLFDENGSETQTNGANGNGLIGKLHGLNEETFCLNWSKIKSNLLASAAGTNVCIWDISRTNGTENDRLPLGNKN